MIAIDARPLERKTTCLKEKYLFFDIDGTLIPFGWDGPPDAGTRRALDAAKRAGHRLFLCTGRTMCDIGKELLSLGFDGIIAGAGAFVRVGMRQIYHSTIGDDLLRDTVDAILRCRVSCLLEGTHGFYYVGRGSRVLPWDFPRIESVQALTGQESVEKFTAHTENRAEFAALGNWLSSRYEIYAAESGVFFEMARIGVNKAAGVRRVLDHCNVSPADAVAFGDSRNDLSMMGAVGTAVAMGGAPEDVRHAATLVTGTLEEDGVAQALERLGLLAGAR